VNIPREGRNLEKNPATGLVVEFFGPMLEFLTLPEDEHNDFCLLKGLMPSDTFVPFHSHPDTEDFIIISGEAQGLRQKTDDTEGYEWIVAKAGDYIHVPSGTPHAWRNVSSEPMVSLITMTKRLARFVQEMGRPVTGEPVTPEYFARFAATAAKYGHWIATPEENAAIGIHL
jgi:mannose-6-phosphate isomerase-like protein (cupin superfamily)